MLASASDPHGSIQSGFRMETSGAGKCAGTDSVSTTKRDGKRSRANTEGESNCHLHGQLRKRRRLPLSSARCQAIATIRRDVQRNAANLRQEGVCPDTLFFPCLSNEMEREQKLRTWIGVPLESLKTMQVRGKKMAWARFPSESDCLDTLLRLKMTNPADKVSLHRPQKMKSSSELNPVSNHMKTFQKRLEDVRKNGGVGNTLMLRNLPNEVDCDEVRAVLRESMEKFNSQTPCHPLRIRTAVSKNGSGRNFWLVYSGVKDCQAAFIAIHLSSLTFRCGRKVKIHAFIHDDSTDANEKKRRERATALGLQCNAVSLETEPSELRMSNVERLEYFLRHNRSNFVFMSPNGTWLNR